MKTRDAEALEFIVNSGLFRAEEDGTVMTSRDRHGRPTDPPVWRKATHISTSKQSSPRNRLWVNGQRVYGARAVYVLTKGPIPDGFQVDHKDDNSLNDRPDNLQLLDSDGNLQKECAREGTRMKRFEPCLGKATATLTEANWEGINKVATAGDVPPIYFAEVPADQRDRRPDFYMCVGKPESIDWTLSFADDFRALGKRLRRWFDRTFLGFR